jgi:NAD-dependent deacetylase
VAQAIKRLGELIGRAERILCFTGAGISTGSNIPDFRGPNGVWQTRRPVYYQEFVASEEARRDYWEFKLEGYPAFRDARPNAAHLAVARLQAMGKLHLLVTQNIDGLHRAAGIDQTKLVELHGTGAEAQCMGCGTRERMGSCVARYEKLRTPPRCERCAELMKPAVVMFGEALDAEALRRAFAAARQADLVLALGSSLSVTPAADVPLAAARQGVSYVIVNQGATAHDELADLKIDDDVCTVLPGALSELGVALV